MNKYDKILLDNALTGRADWVGFRLTELLLIVFVMCLGVLVVKETSVFAYCIVYLQTLLGWRFDQIFAALTIISLSSIVVLYANIRRLRHEFQKRELAEHTIRQISNNDKLTGLPNRATCLSDLSDRIKIHSRSENRFAVLSIDLDNFKNVNDSYGHIIGDKLLRQTANRLQFQLEVGDGLYRISSDEFIVLTGGIREEGDVSTLALKILGAMEKPFYIAGKKAYISCSIGVAIYPVDGNSSDELMINASTAMCHTKGQGKNAFTFFSSDIHLEAKIRANLSNRLRSALEKGEFYLKYQPIVDISKNKIVGAEALIRWNSADLGNISPEIFIPIAEEIGVITHIGKWVLREACRQNKAWQEQGYDPIVISVNLSARQLWQKDYVSLVESVLYETGLEPQYLELELTETMLMKDVDSVVAKLTCLKSLGIALALDDFGTGYSSMAYLRKLKLDRLKIDRCFIEGIPDNAEDIATVNAILSLAKNLNIRVTAEGIETTKQLDFVMASTCELLQGYHFSRPMLPERFEQLMSSVEEACA